MTKTFNDAAQAVEYLTSVIRNDGKERNDSFFVRNVSFILTKDAILTDLPLIEESKLDFDWSWDCAERREPLKAPNGSYTIQRFGDDARPYGDHWDLDLLLDQLRSKEKARRAVLYNGHDACITCFVFWVEKSDLEVTVNLRSSDVGEMLNLDIQYTRHLQQRLSDRLGLSAGEACYNITNAHLLK